MEHKTLAWYDLKLRDDGAGSLEGYASTFENWDDVGERPVKGAFKQHLPDFLTDGFISIGHNWSQLPIATPTVAREDSKGLYVEAQFHSTPDAQAARTVVKERLDRGKSVKLSIGYEVLLDEYVPEGRLLKDVKLYEWSIVTVPANPQAAVTGAKGSIWKDQPLVAHSDAVEAVVKDATLALHGYEDRVAELEGRRGKEGRVLSEPNRKRIQILLDALATVTADLKELLTTTEPRPKAEPAEAEKAFVAMKQYLDELGAFQL